MPSGMSEEVIMVLAAGVAAGLGSPGAIECLRRPWARAEQWIDARRADLFARFSPRRLLVAQAAAASACLGLLAATGQPMLIAPLLAAVFGPPFMLVRACRKRRERLEEQLEKTVFDLADALKASGSVAEGLGHVAEHAASPMREELGLMLREVRFGQSLEGALEGLVARSRSRGASAVATALAIGRRTGGDLPRILDEMAATFREQKRLEGVLRSKTAEGRGQAWVLGAIPPGLVGFLSVSNPGWLEPLWSDPIGWILIGAAVVLELVAILLVRRLVTFAG